MNSFGAKNTLSVSGANYEIFRLDALKGHDITRLPYSLKILLENLLRFEDGKTVTKGDIEALAKWDPKAAPNREIAFRPARVLMQDFTGVPAVVDLAAMREAMKAMGGQATRINPLQPAELVIDHSVQVDRFGSAQALQLNSELEYQRNRERYQFLKWGQQAFHNFKVVPPETGIVHQVNLEYLARVVFTRVNDGNGACLSRHAGRHRFAHHHDQRPGSARLGRGRHRSRGRHARAAGFDADSPGRRLQADGQARRRGDRDRPGAHRHRNASKERGCWQVRGVLRRRPRRAAAGRPRHHRQHGPRIRRHLRPVPHRQGDAGLPAADRAARRSGRPGRGLRPGTGHVPRGWVPGGRLHRYAAPGHGRGRAQPGGAAASPGPRSSQERQAVVPDGVCCHAGRAPDRRRRRCGAQCFRANRGSQGVLGFGRRRDRGSRRTGPRRGSR